MIFIELNLICHLDLLREVGEDRQVSIIIVVGSKLELAGKVVRP